MVKNKGERQKIYRKESLFLAKKHLNFCCTEEEVNNVYLMLRPLKRTFLSRLENFKESEHSGDSILAAEDIMKEPPDARMSPSLAFKNVKVETEERSKNQEFVGDLPLSQKKQATLHKNCAKQITRLISKQQGEIQEVRRILKGERVQLEIMHRMESTLARSIHGNNPVGLDKLKRLDNKFAKKKEEHKRMEEMRLKEIVAKQLAERNKMMETGALFKEKMKSAEQDELSCELSLDGSGLGGTENIVSVSKCLVEERTPNRVLASCMAPCVMSRTAVIEEVGGDVTIKTPIISLCPNHETNELDSIAPENNASVNPPFAEEQIHDEASSSAQDMLLQAVPGMDELTRGNQNVLQEEVPPLCHTDGIGGPTDQTNCEAMAIKHLDQLQLSPPSDSTVGPNQQNPRSAFAVEPQPQSDGPVTSSNAELPQQVENQTPAVPSNLAVLRTGENQLSSDGYISFQNAVASSQLGVTEMLPNPVVSSIQFVMDPPINTLAGLGTNLPLRSAHLSATRIPSKPVSADPLTIELERLRKQTEQADRAYEDTMLRLKSDLEKEIEEVIAETRRKYDAKLHAEEAAFAQKKKELDTNHIKVLMNKRLADCFRSKCLERPSGALEMQPAGAPSANQQTTSPPLQVVHNSSALFSSRPSRPLLISSISPSTGNHQTVSEMRAPAPHLLACRPPPSSSARNLLMASPLVPPLIPSQPPPPQPPLMQPTNYLGLHDRATQPEVSRVSSLHHSSLSAMGLLYHVNNQPGANPPNILPPLPDMSSSFGALDVSQFGGDENEIVLASSGVATDIVCLSDDGE